MKTIHVIFVLLVLFAFAALGNLYLTNHEILNRELALTDTYRAKMWWVILGVFFLGFFLNLCWTLGIELARALKGLNASAATRLGKRISERMHEAKDLLAHGLPKQAAPLLEGILEQRPDHGEARLLLAECQMKAGQSEAALASLQTLCSELPDYVEARYLLAEALNAQRDPEGAAAVLKQLSSDHPKKALRALRRIRAWHLEGGRWTEALEAHKKLTSVFPSEIGPAEKAQGAALLYQTGVQKIEEDQFKEAAQIFQQVMKDNPEFVPAYLGLGRAMILQDQEQQGVEIWLEGFRATGEGVFLQEIEDYFIQLGKPEEGLAVLERVAATSQHSTTAKFFLGKMLYRLEILDRALDLFQEVRSQVVYSPILFFFMAKIHSRRGRTEAALNEYRQLLRNLGVLKLRFECGVCSHKTGEYQDRCESCGSWNSSHFLFKESDLPDAPMRADSGGWMNM
jgi:thioredoxin-like negative regulator of GroEL